MYIYCSITVSPRIRRIYRSRCFFTFSTLKNRQNPVFLLQNKRKMAAQESTAL